MSPWPRIEADLRRSFARRGLPGPLVDDLVQEAALRLMRGLPDLRDPAALGPYVGRVVRSVWTDHLRRRRPSEDLPEALADDPPEVDYAAEVASWLPLLMHKLSDDDQRILRLVELEGRSQVEVARELGLSPSGARSRVQRARRRLLNELEACCKVVRHGGRVTHVEARTDCDCAP